MIRIDQKGFPRHALRVATLTKQEPKPKITVREAAHAAEAYFRQLFPARNVSLEEVELSEDEKHWLITLGYEVEVPMVPSVSALNPFIQPEKKTKYKLFKVNAQTGSVVAMKIRNPE